MPSCWLNKPMKTKLREKTQNLESDICRLLMGLLHIKPQPPGIRHLHKNQCLQDLKLSHAIKSWNTWTTHGVAPHNRVSRIQASWELFFFFCFSVKKEKEKATACFQVNLLPLVFFQGTWVINYIFWWSYPRGSIRWKFTAGAFTIPDAFWCNWRVSARVVCWNCLPFLR